MRYECNYDPKHPEDFENLRANLLSKLNIHTTEDFQLIVKGSLEPSELQVLQYDIRKHNKQIIQQA